MEVPDFRYSALEEQFCKFFTGVCLILKEYGTLNNPFDIKQMLSVLKIQNWKVIRPFEFYLAPLDNAIKTVRASLMKMHVDGHLRIKYVIE
jgi:hypothetical protein